MDVKSEAKETMNFLSREIARKHGAVTNEQLFEMYTVADLRLCAYLQRPLPRLQGGQSPDKQRQEGIRRIWKSSQQHAADHMRGKGLPEEEIAAALAAREPSPSWDVETWIPPFER